MKKIYSKKLPKAFSLKKCEKIVEYDRCLNWAKSHNKDPTHYLKMLNKYTHRFKHPDGHSETEMGQLRKSKDRSKMMG